MKNLLSVFPIGAICLIFVFTVCFFLVHAVKLMRAGWLAQNKKPQNPEPKKEEKKAPAETPQEPIYYIVERKRRTKSSYGEPKRINFK